ncbi:hypothetical protein P7B04_17265 [Sphingobium yanoikuyae]|uniref:hypothetical protein n=1 Tax=Sphingobium yanoikuyae TaxID=13690 RepID=UPI0008466EFE|nr:hypothetical protein [Sphingobium yanoikuyae]MDG2514441.1 hypothetical protein [Sphingobium yanoikuyae]
MSCAFPPITPPLPDTIPTPDPQRRVDGWSPARQRRFLEILAATGVIMLACEGVRITARSAYTLRIRHDGAAFRLGWDAAILIARARLADDLLSRAIMGSEEVIRKDPDNCEVRRHRHDNRLAMSMLARLDRMADSPPEGSDAALARVVAQDFTAYLDLICPAEEADKESELIGLPRTGMEHMARQMADARLLNGDQPETPEPVAPEAATALAPAASVALFIAARLALQPGAKRAPVQPGISPFSDRNERCELRRHIHRADLPPEEAATRLRGVWWDEDREQLRTDYPAPPDFTGDQSGDYYDIDDYDRALTQAEEAAYAAELEAQARPYEEAATRARDARFGFAPGSDEEIAVLEAAGYELLNEDEEDEEEEEDAAAAPAETASDLPGRPQCRTRALL